MGRLRAGLSKERGGGVQPLCRRGESEERKKEGFCVPASR